MLTQLLSQSVESNKLTPLRFDSSCKVSHIMYADDILLYFRVSQKSCLTIKSIFDKYESLTNQRVNLSKSAIYFTKSTPRNTRANIYFYLVSKKINFLSNILVHIFLLVVHLLVLMRIYTLSVNQSLHLGNVIISPKLVNWWLLNPSSTPSQSILLVSIGYLSQLLEKLKL